MMLELIGHIIMFVVIGLVIWRGQLLCLKIEWLEKELRFHTSLAKHGSKWTVETKMTDVKAVGPMGCLITLECSATEDEQPKNYTLVAGRGFTCVKCDSVRSTGRYMDIGWVCKACLTEDE